MTARLVLGAPARWDGDPAPALARRALAAGFDGVGLLDSPRLFSDPWLAADAVLRGTDAVLAGPCVASLGLRHPATVASATRSLLREHPGRVLLVVGRGESSVANEGLPVPSGAAHRTALARLAEHLPVLDGAVVLGAASGPLTTATTAEHLGGVLLDVGADPAVLGRAAVAARDAAPGCRVWAFLRVAVVPSADGAADAVRPLLGSAAARLAASPEWYGLAPDEAATAGRLAAAHDYRRHGAVDAAPAGGDEDAVASRFFVVGEATDVETRVRALLATHLDGLVVAGALPAVWQRLDELGAALARARGSGM